MSKDKNKCTPPPVLEINNQIPVCFHKVVVAGDDVENPPKLGQYRNVIVKYEGNGHIYLFSTDGIPTLIVGDNGTVDYEKLENKPLINGHELVGDSSLADIGVDGAISAAIADLAKVATSGSYNDLADKPTIGEANLTLSRNGVTVESFNANATTDKTIDISVPTTAVEVGALPDTTKYGASLTMSLNQTDYKITITLKDQDGNILGTAQTIDLPLESVVVGGKYDATSKSIILTLQNGNTTSIPVGDLVAGLQTEITETNKLSADLVDDGNTTHKFATNAQLTKVDGLANIKIIGDGLTLANGTLSASGESGGLIFVDLTITSMTTFGDGYEIRATPSKTFAEVKQLFEAGKDIRYRMVVAQGAGPLYSGTYEIAPLSLNYVDNVEFVYAAFMGQSSGVLASASIAHWSYDTTSPVAIYIASVPSWLNLATVATTGSYNDLIDTPAKITNAEIDTMMGVA